MGIKRIKKLFERYSVAVCGQKGSGKDVLFGNVIARRKLPYVSNTNYGGQYIPFDANALMCGGNTYMNFLKGNIKAYSYPYKDKTDIYLADVGVYFPSQYCNELNKNFPQIPVFEALSRHLGDAKLHYNVQAINRSWDKIREQCDIYIQCIRCIFIGQLVIQKVRVYEKYSSAADKVLPWRLRLPLLANKEMRLHYELQKQQYENAHGKIRDYILIYINRSKHDTRSFRTMLLGGEKLEKIN